MRAKTDDHGRCNCPYCRMERIEMAVEEIASLITDMMKQAEGRKPRA